MKKLVGYFTFVIAGIMILQSNLAYSATGHDMPIGRYLTVDNRPQPWQVNLLSQSIQVRFSQAVQTIGDAMNYLLRFSGYGLVPRERMNSALQITLTKPLPVVDRHLGPMPLKDALSTLAGPAFYLVQDPVNRLVDFRLKPAFAKLYVVNRHITSVKQ